MQRDYNYLIDGGSHIDKVLTNLAMKNFSSRQGYIADAIFPNVPVGKQSDKYFVIDKATYLLIPDTARAPGAPANTIEFLLSSESYFADNYALGTDTPNETLANADIGANSIRQANNEIILDGLARDREQRAANIVTSISNVGSGLALTGSDKWSDAVGSDPVGQINSGHAFVRQNTGLKANTLSLDEDSLVTLQTHPQIRDFVKYTQSGPVPTSEIARLFRVNTIHVADGVYNSAKEGQAASMANIWGNFCLLTHTAPTRGMQTATFGLSYGWQPAGFPSGMVVERYPHHNRSKKSEHQEAQYFADEKIVGKDLSYLIKDTL